MAHLMATVYVALGPIFISLALFAPTRPIFSAFVGALISTVVLQGLALALASLLVGAEGAMANAVLVSAPTETYGRVGMLFGACMVFSLAGWFALRLPAVAASLCGGVHFAPTALVAMTYGSIQNGASAAINTAGNYAGQGVQAARRGLSGPSSIPPAGPSLSRSASAQGTNR